MMGFKKGNGRRLETEREKAARSAAGLKAEVSVRMEALEEELDARYGLKELEEALRQSLHRQLDALQGAHEIGDRGDHR